MLEITKASLKETANVINHYKTVIDQIKNYDYTPGWKFGIHPTEEHIVNAIKSGELYIGKINSIMVASLIIDHNPLEANDKIEWTYDLNADETFFIHLVAVNQDYRNKGLAKQMINFAFRLAEEKAIKSIRLSLNVTNLNIEKLYLNTGFKYMGTQEVFIENRGHVTFNLYEKII